MPFSNIKTLFILIIIIHGIWIHNKGYANCLSFLPHGYNGLFVHLPKSETFCVDTPDGTVPYHTNRYGARVIKGNSANKAIYAFGESQLIEIFPRRDGIKHALQLIYGNQTLYLHGAPNNGPNETLAFIKYVANNSQKKLTKITVGINLGFDLFRIIPGWQTSKKVPFDSSEISFMLKFPYIFEIINAGNMLFSNKYEIIEAEKKILEARSYFHKSKKYIEKFLPLWFKDLSKLKKSHALNVDIVFYQAYWVYDLNLEKDLLELNPIYSRLIKRTICKHLSTEKSINRFYFLNYEQNISPKELFSYTFRHFKQLPTKINSLFNYCKEY